MREAETFFTAFNTVHRRKESEKLSLFGSYFINDSEREREVKKVAADKKKFFTTEVFGSTGSVGTGHFVHYSRKSVTLRFFRENFNSRIG